MPSILKHFSWTRPSRRPACCARRVARSAARERWRARRRSAGSPPLAGGLCYLRASRQEMAVRQCAQPSNAPQPTPAWQPLLEVIQGFLAVERQALRQDLKQREVSPTACHRPHGCKATRGASNQLPRLPMPQAATAAAELAPAQQQAQVLGSSSSNWQKKGGGAAAAAPAASGLWADALGAAALLSAAAGGSGLDGTELELAAAEEAAAAARGGPRQELVVVASLLTKAPNLAGLARTCEVFRCAGLDSFATCKCPPPLLSPPGGVPCAWACRAHACSLQPARSRIAPHLRSRAGPARWFWATWPSHAKKSSPPSQLPPTTG